MKTKTTSNSRIFPVKEMILIGFFSCFFMATISGQSVTIAFQGGEDSDNWGYTSNGASAAVVGYATLSGNKKSGTTSLAVGGNNSSGGDCISGCCTGNGPNMAHGFTFDDLDISASNTQTRTLSFWYGNYQPQSCSGPGWDASENLIYTPYHDGVAQASQSIVNGGSNLSVPINSSFFTSTIPPGVNTFHFTLSITTNRNDEHLYLDNVLLTSPDPLPVHLLSFSGDEEEGITKLYWSTASEKNNSGYEIEKSADGITFYKIGFVKGNENSSKIIQYNFSDENVTSNAYYRLKQFDTDGQFSYSPVISITDKNSGNWLHLYPIPASENLMLDLYSEAPSSVSIEVLDILSKVVGSFEYPLTKGGNTLLTDVSFLENGTYFVSITSALGKREIRKIQVLR